MTDSSAVRQHFIDTGHRAQGTSVREGLDWVECRECEEQSWGDPVPPQKITIPGFGTLTRRGEIVLVLLALALLVGTLALVGGMEQ